MNNIKFYKIINKEELDILNNQKSIFDNIVYDFNQKSIDFLKNNLDSKNSLYLIAKQDNDFVGFVAVDAEWWEDDSFFIREIFVNPDFQRQKIGSQLIEKCINHAKEKDVKAVVTQTSFENIRMKKLCTKLGFEEWNNPQWKEGITYKLKLQ